MPNAGNTSTRTMPWWPSRSGPRTTPGSRRCCAWGRPTRGEPAAAADFVYRQIESAVDGDWDLAGRLTIAYEPVWAIGAAEPAAAAYVSDVVQRLRAKLTVAGVPGLPVIYGGSAKPGLLPTLEGVSGLFLGRFAHDPANFGTVLDEALLLAEGFPAA